MICKYVDTFSHSESCLFTLWIVSFDAQNLKIFMKSNLFIFSLVACAFGVISRNHCKIQCYEAFALSFLL